MASDLLGNSATEKFLEACATNLVGEKELKEIASQISEAEVYGKLEREIRANRYDGRSTGKFMLKTWLKVQEGEDTPADKVMSVERLQQILRSPDVGLKHLALTLAEKHLPDPNKNSVETHLTMLVPEDVIVGQEGDENGMDQLGDPKARRMEWIQKLKKLEEATQVNIVVLGQIGVGKSSFINRLRNIHDEEDENYASKDVLECTKILIPTKDSDSHQNKTNKRLQFYHSSEFAGMANLFGNTTINSDMKQNNQNQHNGRKMWLKKHVCLSKSLVKKMILLLMFLIPFSTAHVTGEKIRMNDKFPAYLLKTNNDKTSILLPPDTNWDQVCELLLLVKIPSEQIGQTVFTAEHAKFGNGPLEFTLVSDGRNIWREQSFCFASCENVAKSPLLLSATSDLTMKTDITIIPKMRKNTCKRPTNPFSHISVLGLIFVVTFAFTTILLLTKQHFKLAINVLTSQEQNTEKQQQIQFYEFPKNHS